MYLGTVPQFHVWIRRFTEQGDPTRRCLIRQAAFDASSRTEAFNGPWLAEAVGMSGARAWFFVSLVTATGCISTTTETRFVPDGERPVLVAPEANASTLDARVWYENGIVKGHLTWSRRCRPGIESLSHDDVYQVKTPNKAAGTVAILVGALAGVISGAVLSDAHTLSDEETCSTSSSGDTHCSSPRRDATIGGTIGLVGGISVAVAGLATFVMRPTKQLLEPVVHSPQLTKVESREAPCGEGKVEGMGVALLRGGNKIAASSTNADGDFALLVPERTTGPLTIIVDAVAQGATLTRANELLATIDIPAVPQKIDAPETEIPSEPKAQENQSNCGNMHHSEAAPIPRSTRR